MIPNPHRQGVDAVLHQCAHKKFANASELSSFVGGRRAINAHRRHIAELRRLDVAKLLASVDVSVRGWRSQLATEAGISRRTLGRYIDAIREESEKQKQSRIDADFARRREFSERLERSLDPSPRDLEWRPIR
jgi:hypothetical protein